MAVLSVQQILRTGTGVTFASANSGGDSFPNTGNEVLHVKNGGGSSVTVTINSQAQCSFGFDHDETVSVPAGGEREIGPFPKSRFNDTSDRVNVTYSAVTSVTVAVKQFVPAAN